MSETKRSVSIVYIHRQEWYLQLLVGHPKRSASIESHAWEKYAFLPTRDKVWITLTWLGNCILRSHEHQSSLSRENNNNNANIKQNQLRARILRTWMNKLETLEIVSIWRNAWDEIELGMECVDLFVCHGWCMYVVEWEMKWVVVVVVIVCGGSYFGEVAEIAKYII